MRTASSGSAGSLAAIGNCSTVHCGLPAVSVRRLARDVTVGPRAGVKIDGAAGAMDEAEVIVRAGEERAVGDQLKEGAVGGEADVGEEDRELGGGVEERGQVGFGPDDGIGEVEEGADRGAVGGELVGGETDDCGFAGAETEAGRGGGEGFARGAVDEVADDGDAGGLDAATVSSTA